MSPVLLRTLLLGLAAAQILGAEPALAQSLDSANNPARPAPQTRVLTGDEAYAVALQVMVANGRFSDALQLIQSMPRERRSDPAMALLQAQLLRRADQANQAVEVYHSLLARFPKDQRVRLELAETLFGLKDLRASEYYFRLALSGILPEDDRKLARVYLNQILAQRPWTITGGIGVAPDSNVNGATSAQQVELWGLPFRLSDEARQREGVNLNGYLSGQGSVAIGKSARLVGSSWINVSENRARSFSSEAIGVRLGPEFSARERRWSINGLAERRWYGGDELYSAGGVSLDTDFAVKQGLVVYGVAVSAQHLDYDALQDRDGWVYGLDVQRTRYLSPQRFWRASASLRINRARTGPESYALGRVSAGLYQRLPLRLGLYVEPSVGITRYDAPAILFGVVREDRELALAARLLKEDYSVWGFAPYIGGAVSLTESNIPLFEYTRQRVEVGVTRTF